MDDFRKQKWMFFLVTIILLSFSLLTACGSSSDKPPPTTETKTTSKAAEKTENSANDKKAENKVKTVADIALYQGSDREQILTEAAKKEGSLSMYTSMNLEDLQPLAAAFEKKYGIKVNVWRSTGENIIQRVVTEANGKRFDMDVMETAAPQLEMTAREKLTQEFYSPSLKSVPPEAVASHKQWVATRFNFFVTAYNTNSVKPEDVPKTYEDLLDPKWKGKISIETEDAPWFAMIAKVWGEPKAIEYFTKLSQQNLILRKGHTLITELIASGEIPLSVTVYNHKAEQLKKEGAPVDWKPLAPTVGEPSGILLAKNAPHPHAAMLFIDFILSYEGQKIIADRGRVPVNNQIETKLNKFPYVMSDPIIILDEFKKWDELFSKIISKK